jgi:hypothetical protein
MPNPAAIVRFGVSVYWSRRYASTIIAGVMILRSTAMCVNSLDCAWEVSRSPDKRSDIRDSLSAA